MVMKMHFCPPHPTIEDTRSSIYTSCMLLWFSVASVSGYIVCIRQVSRVL